VETLIGDRAPNPGQLDALRGTREWDVVIDNPTTRPRWVREAAEALKGRVGQYVFISTISVYAANDTPGADETAAVLTTDTPDVESGPEFNRLYGPLKALSEQEAQKAFPGRATIIRPGLIVGVGDQSDRFTYWPVRIAKGGEVLAPPPDDPVQIIDARDLVHPLLRERRLRRVQRHRACDAIHGAPDARGRESGRGRRRTVHVRDGRVPRGAAAACSPVAGSPGVDGADRPQCGIHPAQHRARANGLTFRPYADTVRETLAFYHTQPPERQAQLRFGIAAEREREVLAAWHARGDTR
jgi:2'-hydroxyisoflavone reductase